MIIMIRAIVTIAVFIIYFADVFTPNWTLNPISPVFGSSSSSSINSHSGVPGPVIIHHSPDQDNDDEAGANHHSESDKIISKQNHFHPDYSSLKYFSENDSFNHWYLSFGLERPPKVLC